MAKMGFLDVAATALVIVGAINWGLVGAFGWNLVEALFGTGVLSTITYVLVGVSGVWSGFRLAFR